jgi:hypothetical protein
MTEVQTLFYTTAQKGSYAYAITTIESAGNNIGRSRDFGWNFIAWTSLRVRNSDFGNLGTTFSNIVTVTERTLCGHWDIS